MIAKKIFLSLLLTIVITPKVFSLKCYQCNSDNNSDCATLPYYKSKNVRSIEPSECVGGGKGEEPLCRKTVLSVSNNDNDWFDRTIRGCGYQKAEKDCYNNNNDDHLERVCQCFEDGCNSAYLTVPTSVLILVPLAAIMCMKIFAF